MKKWAVLFIALLFTTTASAQVISNPSPNARMLGLGVPNHQINDDFNIWINPAQITNYKNAIYGELGTYAVAGGTVVADDIAATTQWGGMNIGTANGTWGLYIGRPVGPITAAIAGTPLSAVLVGGGAGAAFPVAPSNNRFDLFYALPNTPVGFYLGYADTSVEIDPAAGASTDDTATEINFGVGALLMDGALDLALNITSASYESDTSVAAGVDEDVTAWSLLARHQQDVGMGRLISTGQIASANFDESDIDTIALTVDTALNSRPNEDTLVIAGIGITSTTLSNGTDVSTLAIPVNLSVEHQTFSKVQTRFGVAKPIYSTTNVDVTGGAETTTVLDGPATVAVGLGWMVTDNLSVDAVINQDVLFTGTWLVSGVAESLSSVLSASWRFE